MKKWKILALFMNFLVVSLFLLALWLYKNNQNGTIALIFSTVLFFPTITLTGFCWPTRDES